MQRFTSFCNYMGMMLSLIGILVGAIVAVVFYFNAEIFLINGLVTINEEVLTYTEENLDITRLIFLEAGIGAMVIALISFNLSAINHHIVSSDYTYDRGAYIASGLFSIIFGPRFAGLLTIIYGFTDAI